VQRDGCSLLGVFAGLALAILIPARRETNVNPMIALHYEWKGQSIARPHRISVAHGPGIVRSNGVGGIARALSPTAALYTSVGIPFPGALSL